MKEFKPQFIIQFIIDFLVFGIIYTVISRVITGAIVNAIDISGYFRCYPIVLLQNIFICLALISALFVTQKAVSKKNVSSPDEPQRFYRTFCIVLAIIGLASSFIGIFGLTEVCKENIDSLTMFTDLRTDYPELNIDQITEKFYSGVRLNVFIATAVSAVIQTAALIGVSVPLGRRHERLF